MLWKIYFWMVSVLVALSIIGFVGELLSGQISGIILQFVAIMSLLAVYSYVFKKYVFPQKRWKVWLLLVVLIELIKLVPLFSSEIILDPFIIAVIFFGFITLTLPPLYCMYKLGYGAENRKSVISKLHKKRGSK